MPSSLSPVDDSAADKTNDERIRSLALTADVGTSLTTRQTLSEMLRGCTEALVTHLDAAFARIWVLEEAENVLVLKASAGLYTHLDGPHGRVPVGQFKIGLIAEEGKPHLTNAVVGDPRVSDQEWAVREGMVSFAGYPLHVEGRVIGVVAIFARYPLSVVTLETLGAVADEIALGIEGKRAEAALRTSEQRLQETQARLEAALSAGGIATWTWDLTTDLLIVDAEFARLFSVSAEYAAGGKSETHFRAIHPDDRSTVEQAIAEAINGRDVYEAEYRVVMPDSSHRWLSARGRIQRDGVGRAIGLSGSALDVTARKTVEAARDQAQAALLQYEHTIAFQLQAALQPELPGTVPGIKLARYYEAALPEAGVGGDFYDVFGIEKGRTALVVGDLSGKGLQAAAQVSTVRNMLRAFLYSKPTVAEAVTDLNRVLAENNLLAGFSTLFVGAYDSGTRTLTFVNCGQEPALLRRSGTGTIEALLPTGPVLGTWESAQYTEEAATLAPGDALAIFSDGLTEVGPNRLEMLGIEGVTALFAAPVAAAQLQDAAEFAEHLALRLIEGVDAAAADGLMRDDVCLLIAVAE